MIEENGRVVAVSEQEAWIQVFRQSACTACSAQKVCGQKLLNSLGSGKAHQFRVENRLGVRVGDEVVVGVPESALLMASFLLYLIPLVSMIAVAVALKFVFSPGDGWIIVGSLCGLALGFIPARRLGARAQHLDQIHPRLLRRLATSVAMSTVPEPHGEAYSGMETKS